MDKQILEIKGDGDLSPSEARLTVAKILIGSGYTVRQTATVKPGTKTKITVLEYWKEK